MKKNDLIHDYLIQHGWMYKGHCNCGGMATYKYNTTTQTGEYRLKIRASTHLLSKPGERFYKNSNNELKRTIDEISILKAQDKIQSISK